eukprot:Polyplicarium_translucidae@DN3352_c0_g1_i1.p1
MITGDGADTAAKIAKECRIVRPETRLLFGNLDREARQAGTVTWVRVEDSQPIQSLDTFKNQLRDGDVELIVSGTAFEVLAALPVDPSSRFSAPLRGKEGEEGESRMSDILRYTRIFSRMKPNQKQACVAMHMRQGITSMCGDGANDAAALQRAHAGLALQSKVKGSEDATIVAHFTTAAPSIAALATVIKEGRATLATTVHAYKTLICYGQSLAIASLVCAYFGFIMPEAVYFYGDFFTTILFAMTILTAKRTDLMRPHRPTAKLLGREVALSAGLHSVNNALWLIFAVVFLFQQDWFLCKEFDMNTVDPERWWLKGDNFEALTVSVMVIFQWGSTANVFNFGSVPTKMHVPMFQGVPTNIHVHVPMF